MWSSVVIAYTIFFAILCLVSLLIFSRNKDKSERPIQDFLLAGNSLGRASVISLLLSTSFGLNSLLYQVWLGYSIGAWALVAQGAWAMSFVLLSYFSDTVRQYNSLHDLIGHHFTISSRVIAGICSIVGIMYLMGWEVSIAKVTLEHAFIETEGSELVGVSSRASILIFGIVGGCLGYTLLGGLRGNANIDGLLNLFKLISILILSIIAINIFVQSGGDVWNSFFPSIESMEQRLGWWGLITNVVFSLAWQFVDNSTWQSIIGGREKHLGDAASNLRLSGLTIFIVPGVIGTILGVSLTNISGVTDSNILAKAITILPGISSILLICALIAIIGCVMSVIDGLFLASAYTLIIDIFYSQKKLNELDSNHEKAEAVLAKVRIAIVVIALTGIFGVQYLLETVFDKTVFDFLYLVIITQISLTGPVLIALFRIPTKPYAANVAILSSLSVGFISVLMGGLSDQKWLLDGAGSFTAITSIILTLIFKHQRLNGNNS
jgi:hypothetical protein